MFSDSFENLCIKREEGERIISLHREGVANGDISRLMDKKVSAVSRFTKGYQVFGCMDDFEIKRLIVKFSANLTDICRHYQQLLHIKSIDTLYISWRIRCSGHLVYIADKILKMKIGSVPKQKRGASWEWNPYKDPKGRAIKGNYTMDYLEEYFSGRLKYSSFNNSYMLDDRPVKVQELMRQCGLMKVVEDLGYV